MITQSQIFRQIESLLANKISLGDFEDWLVRSSWNMHLDSGSEDRELVWKIELNLAEHSSGHLDETDLLAQLRGLVPHLHQQTDRHASHQEANSVIT